MWHDLLHFTGGALVCQAAPVLRPADQQPLLPQLRAPRGHRPHKRLRRLPEGHHTPPRRRQPAGVTRVGVGAIEAKHFTQQDQYGQCYMKTQWTFRSNGFDLLELWEWLLSVWEWKLEKMFFFLSLTNHKLPGINVFFIEGKETDSSGDCTQETPSTGLLYHSKHILYKRDLVCYRFLQNNKSGMQSEGKKLVASCLSLGELWVA